MSFNLFDWIRDGVRQSVLLGVSDAIDTIGTPDGGGEIKPELAAMLSAPTSNPQQKRASGTQRKRLGKSLNEIQSTAKRGS